MKSLPEIIHDNKAPELAAGRNLFAVIVNERGSGQSAYAVRADKPEEAISLVMELRQRDGGNGNWAHVVTVTWLHDERLAKQEPAS